MTKKSTGTELDDSGNAEVIESVNFEAALAELEQLVAKMEDGELTLDESLKAFERGVTLTRQCQTALQQAELKVQALTKDGQLEDLAQDPSLQSLNDARANTPQRTHCRRS